MGGGIPSNVVPLDRVRPSEDEIPEPVDASEPETMGPLPIEEIPSQEGEAINIKRIRQVVAMRYRISLEAIRSDSRNQFVMLPRQIAYTLARRMTGRSFPAIGRAFGGRDHTTILHGIRKVEKRASLDPAFALELDQLERLIAGKGDLPCPCCGAVSGAAND